MSKSKSFVKERLSSLIEKYSSRDVVQQLEKQFKSLQPYEIDPEIIQDIPILKQVTIRQDQLRDILVKIGHQGVLSPLVLRDVHGDYQIILGRKIWYATKVLKLKKIPVVITKMSEEEMLLVLLASLREESEQNVIAIALVCEALIDHFQYRQVALAKIMHYSRSQVSNLLRLLKLPTFTRKLINAQTITYGHAKILVSLEPELIDQLVMRLIQEKLSVRDFEKLVKQHKPQTILPVDEQSLSHQYKAKVSSTKKSIKLSFDSSDALSAFVNEIARKK